MILHIEKLRLRKVQESARGSVFSWFWSWYYNTLWYYDPYCLSSEVLKILLLSHQFGFKLQWYFIKPVMKTFYYFFPSSTPTHPNNSHPQNSLNAGFTVVLPCLKSFNGSLFYKGQGRNFWTLQIYPNMFCVCVCVRVCTGWRLNPGPVHVRYPNLFLSLSYPSLFYVILYFITAAVANCFHLLLRCSCSF